MQNLLKRPCNSLLTTVVLVSTFATFACKKEEDKNFLVTVAGDGHISTTAAGPFSVKEKENFSIEVTSTSAVNELSPTVDGDCPAGTWSGGTYTTGPIVADCTLGFAVMLKITSSAGANVTVSPLGDTLSHSTKTLTYSTTAADGYFVSQMAGGTCPVGYWSGNDYNLNRLSDDCTVEFTAGTFVVTATGDTNQYVGPASSAAVNTGEKVTFEIQHSNNKKASLLVEGTCPAGAWTAENIYTTGSIVAECTVIFKSE